MLSRVIAKNVRDVFFETQCIYDNVGRVCSTNHTLVEHEKCSCCHNAVL